MMKLLQVKTGPNCVWGSRIIQLGRTPSVFISLKEYSTIFALFLFQVSASGKEYYVAFNDVDAQLKVRGLTSERIGKLLRITGQVVRTHPVHPELVIGTFKCADCQTVMSDVEQQFKYTQVSSTYINQHFNCG